MTWPSMFPVIDGNNIPSMTGTVDLQAFRELLPVVTSATADQPRDRARPAYLCDHK